MYNRELKERYIATRTDKTQQGYRSLFEYSGDFEQKMQKDIAEFSCSEFAEMLETWGFSEPENIRSRQAMIAPYADWYIQEVGLAGHHIRDYDLFSFPYAKLFMSTLTVEPDELIYKITRIFELDSAQSAIPALCFAWLGINKKDALALKKNQIDFETGKIYAENGDVVVNQVPKCMLEALMVYDQTKKAVRVHAYSVPVFADETEFFIKRMRYEVSEKRPGMLGVKELDNSIELLRKKYREQFGEEAATPLNYTNVQRSGNFYRLHELAKSGVDVFSMKNKDLVRSILGQSKRYHKDNMVMYRAYLECISEGIEN